MYWGSATSTPGNCGFSIQSLVYNINQRCMVFIYTSADISENGVLKLSETSLKLWAWRRIRPDPCRIYVVNWSSIWIIAVIELAAELQNHEECTLFNIACDQPKVILLFRVWIRTGYLSLSGFDWLWTIQYQNGLLKLYFVYCCIVHSAAADNQKHVFISYQWDSKPTVLTICERLKTAGFKIWVDVDNMCKYSNDLSSVLMKHHIMGCILVGCIGNLVQLFSFVRKNC